MKAPWSISKRQESKENKQDEFPRDDTLLSPESLERHQEAWIRRHYEPHFGKEEVQSLLSQAWSGKEREQLARSLNERIAREQTRRQDEPSDENASIDRAIKEHLSKEEESQSRYASMGFWGLPKGSREVNRQVPDKDTGKSPDAGEGEVIPPGERTRAEEMPKEEKTYAEIVQIGREGRNPWISIYDDKGEEVIARYRYIGTRIAPMPPQTIVNPMLQGSISREDMHDLRNNPKARHLFFEKKESREPLVTYPPGEKQLEAGKRREDELKRSGEKPMVQWPEDQAEQGEEKEETHRGNFKVSKERQERTDVFRKRVERVLKRMDEVTGNRNNFYSENAVNLLLGTALQESQGLRYRMQQTESGDMAEGARGLLQMEKPTFDFFWKQYLLRPDKRNIKKGMDVMFTSNGKGISVDSLVEDDDLAIAMARLKYFIVTDPIPDTLRGQAKYWKDHYNTSRGKGTPEKYMESWNSNGGTKWLRE